MVLVFLVEIIRGLELSTRLETVGYRYQANILQIPGELELSITDTRRIYVLKVLS